MERRYISDYTASHPARLIFVVAALRALNLISSDNQCSDEAADRTTVESGFDFWRGYEGFLFSRTPDWLRGPLDLQYSGYLEFLSGVKAAGT